MDKLIFDLQRHSADRILGSMTQLQVYSSNGPITFAELDGFTVSDKTEQKKFQPLGQVAPHGQLIYAGYELSFKGAKIDDSWDNLQSSNDTALLAGQSAPRYRIVDTTTWFDGTVETWIYDQVLLYNFKSDKAAAGEEIKQDFTGFAATRIRG
jgi:hypothetical protein